MQDLDLDIRHWSGKTNKNPDALSKNPIEANCLPGLTATLPHWADSKDLYVADSEQLEEAPHGLHTPKRASYWDGHHGGHSRVPGMLTPANGTLTTHKLPQSRPPVMS